MDAIYNLIEPYARYPHKPPHYVDVMMHDIPAAPVVKREKFILEKCMGKNVVHFGSAGNKGLHQVMVKVAKRAIGVDKDDPCDYKMDLEKAIYIKQILPSKNDLLVCGEILEHLSNPGHFLSELKLFAIPVIITVPNGMCTAVQRYAEAGVEHVNRDHVAWYSWHTLKTLVERVGFKVKEFAWYNGKPYFAEGLIFVVE